jgi:hypothetical protein
LGAYLHKKKENLITRFSYKASISNAHIKRTTLTAKDIHLLLNGFVQSIPRDLGCSHKIAPFVQRQAGLPADRLSFKTQHLPFPGYYLHIPSGYKELLAKANETR